MVRSMCLRIWWGCHRLPVTNTTDSCLVANLSGYLVRHSLAHLPWDIPAGLSGYLEWLLLGNVIADLLGHAVTHLLRNIIAYGLGNSPGSVNTLGLGDLGAPWAGNKAGLLDWPLVADTLDLSLTPWGTSGDGTSKNRLNGNIALNSNQSSPGLSTVLGGDVCALVNKGRINNWVRFSDAVLTSGCGTLLVGHLLDNISADLLRLIVADLLRFGVTHFFGHSVANLF